MKKLIFKKIKRNLVFWVLENVWISIRDWQINYIGVQKMKIMNKRGQEEKKTGK